MTDAILVLTTGGTIDKSYFDSLSAYHFGDSVIARILEIARVRHPVVIDDVMRKDSLEITAADRETIRRRVVAADHARVVITHGTDTMAATGAALAGIRDKTIVLVGALAPARFAESDAAFNLGMAFAAAQLAAPGVYITMNGTVFPAGEVEKDRAKGEFGWRDSAAAPAGRAD